MNILNETKYKFIKEVLEVDNISSIFISGWNSIYVISNDGYKKSFTTFKNIEEYLQFSSDIMEMLKINSLDYIVVDAIKIYVHKMDELNYWINLIKE